MGKVTTIGALATNAVVTADTIDVENTSLALVGADCTLADGILGQRLVIKATADGVDITVTNFTDGATIALDDNEACELMFDGSEWVVISNYGGTIA